MTPLPELASVELLEKRGGSVEDGREGWKGGEATTRLRMETGRIVLHGVGSRLHARKLCGPIIVRYALRLRLLVHQAP